MLILYLLALYFLMGLLVLNKISNVEQNRVLFDSRLNGMGPYPTGKLSAMVNIPNDINRVRISFLPVSSTGRVSVQRSSRAWFW